MSPQRIVFARKLEVVHKQVGGCLILYYLQGSYLTKEVIWPDVRASPCRPLLMATSWVTHSVLWEGRYRAGRPVKKIQSLENCGRRYVAFGIFAVFTCMHGIESGKSSLSSGPIASGKTVGLLDTFLIGPLSVYNLLIIILYDNHHGLNICLHILSSPWWSSIIVINYNDNIVQPQLPISLLIFFRNLWLCVIHALR